MLRKILGGVLAAMLFAAPAMAGDSEACRKVRLSDVGWTDITATTAVTSVLLEAWATSRGRRCCRCRSPTSR